MAQAMPRLVMIAEPKASYRPRYMREGRPYSNRAQRFFHADDNPYKYIYPTIEIPEEWNNELQQPRYIRVTHVTVPNEQVDVRCVHPYPINTEDNNVIKDSLTNSLYFPVSADDLISGRKSFQFTLYKLTQYELKTHGPLRILNSEITDKQRLEDPTDVRKLIETYQLGQSQLLFSIAAFQNNQQPPIIYDISSVFSQIMTAMITSTNDDDSSFRCTPQRGDWQGREEILMVIPKIDKRKAFTVRFEHPSIDQRSTVNMEFVDTKTISFYTPPCPVLLTRDNPSVSIPIVVTQNDIEIVRFDFVYQSLDICLTCNTNFISTNSDSPNSNKRSFADYEETDGVQLHDLTLNRKTKQECDLSHIRDFIIATQKTSAIKSEDQFSSLENAIQQGNIDLAIQLIKLSTNYLEQENNQGETPLLLAGKFNQKRLIKAILEQRPELAKQVDEQGNNLLHLLANVSENKAKKTIETVLTLLDNKTKECLISGLNKHKQTPKQVAENHNNMQYIDLLNCKMTYLDSDIS